MDRNIGSDQQSMELLYDLGQLLNTGLSREQLRLCVELLRAGESPEGIATVVKELRKEAASAREAPMSRATSTSSSVRPA